MSPKRQPSRDEDAAMRPDAKQREQLRLHQRELDVRAQVGDFRVEAAERIVTDRIEHLLIPATIDSPGRAERRSARACI
jgi:hypothetical protein